MLGNPLHSVACKALSISNPCNNHQSVSKKNLQTVLQRQDHFQQSHCRVQESNYEIIYLSNTQIAGKQKNVQAWPNVVDVRPYATGEAIHHFSSQLPNTYQCMNVKR